MIEPRRALILMIGLLLVWVTWTLAGQKTPPWQPYATGTMRLNWSQESQGVPGSPASEIRITCVQVSTPSPQVKVIPLPKDAKGHYVTHVKDYPVPLKDVIPNVVEYLCSNSAAYVDPVTGTLGESELSRATAFLCKADKCRTAEPGESLTVP
jgi:hypothetical protein